MFASYSHRSWVFGGGRQSVPSGRSRARASAKLGSLRRLVPSEDRPPRAGCRAV